MYLRWVKRDKMRYLANKKMIASFFGLLFVVLALLFWYFDTKVTKQTMMKLSDELSMALNSQIEKEQSLALRYALIISQNQSLTNAIDEDDEDKGYEILSQIMESIKLHTNSLIRSQIITSDFFIFARSWDNSYAGMPLDYHRPDLLYFQTHKKPRSAIEVGRKIGIKATVPVFFEKKMVGFVEVVSFFESVLEYFDSLGIDLYILMDEKFYDTAVFMRDNPHIARDYVLANTRFTNSELELLNSINYDTLKREKLLEHKDRYLFYEPMKNGEGDIIGAFVLSLSQKQISSYAHTSEDDISFLIHLSRSELYNLAYKKIAPDGLYQSVYDKELLEIKDVVSPEDRELFLQEAKDRLNEYSKEELIGLILGYKASKEIRGEIR